MSNNLREFKVGEKVKILNDRRECWQDAGEFEIINIVNHGFNKSVGHFQTLIMKGGGVFSGWWFDPAAVCLWAKDNRVVENALPNSHNQS